LLDTAVATAFATEYHNPPIKATVEIRTMSWGTLFYTLTNSLKHQLKQGQMLQFRGMLTGVWRAEENVCNHENYAFMKMTNQTHRLETLVAVLQDRVKFPVPVDNNEGCRQVLSLEWSTGCSGAISKPVEQVSWQNEMSMAPMESVGMIAQLRWEAIAVPNTYSV
jgi:hypothetical protein